MFHIEYRIWVIEYRIQNVQNIEYMNIGYRIQNYTGIQNVLLEHDIYSPGMVKSAMSESNDIRGKRGTIFLAEILRLQVDVFAFSLHNAFKNTKLEENRISLQNLCQNHNPKTKYS